jgi:hypothetical protein
LELVRLSDEEDEWRWVPDPEGTFSVKSAYNHLVNLHGNLEEMDNEVEVVFEQIWESLAPSKVIAFSWQLLYDRIPTSCNLQLQGVIPTEDSRECVSCVGRLETSNNLILHCPKAMMVWYGVFRWLRVVIVMPSSISSLFEVVRGVAKNKKGRLGFLMIWHVSIWSIWKA